MKNTDFINYINMLEKANVLYSIYHDEDKIIVRIDDMIGAQAIVRSAFSEVSEDLVSVELHNLISYDV